jgi:hypothetical protein
MAGGTDDLMDLFDIRDAGPVATEVHPIESKVAEITRRPGSTVTAAVKTLSLAPQDLADLTLLQRVWRALQLAERFGVTPEAVHGWTETVLPAASSDNRCKIAREVRDSIKARYDEESWRRVAQPIFDRLRQRQRDALSSKARQRLGLDTLEQLYEYFLIDPGMEPVVQTSRIRLAISSLQLFIQRCLLNMEPKVHPALISAARWEWMKRYRVWEANRKIFLFPENWLEPEFRDDKTHLFSELEGALLQGDVSSDLVEDAFLVYLKKLDELARLDMVGLHIEDSIDPAQRVLHVIGRTFSTPHKYFHRRYEHQAWTAWEPVDVEIQGDHLAPVVWRDRLYLFWVTFLEKGPEEISDASGGSEQIGEMTLTALIAGAKAAAGRKRVGVHLHWAEFLRGEWSTSLSDGPSAVIEVEVHGSFTASESFIHVSKEFDPADGSELGVYVHLSGGSIDKAFYLAGRNSAPEEVDCQDPPPYPFFESFRLSKANRYGYLRDFGVIYLREISTNPEVGSASALELIMTGPTPFIILPCNNRLTAPGVLEDAFEGASNLDAVEDAIESGLEELEALTRPVFYQDRSNTFYVEPTVVEDTIESWTSWLQKPVAEEDEESPASWLPELDIVPAAPPQGGRGWFGSSAHSPPIDPHSLLPAATTQDWLLNPQTVLAFDRTLIGPTGDLGLVLDPAGRSAAPGVHVSVSQATGVVAGVGVAISDPINLARSGLAIAADGLKVAGASSVNLNRLSRASNLDPSNPGRRNSPPREFP